MKVPPAPVLSVPFFVMSILTWYSSIPIESTTVESLKLWVVFILLSETLLNSYLNTKSFCKCLAWTVDSNALPIPIRVPETPVPDVTPSYLIISSPILTYPGFVFETPTFSNVSKFVVLAMEITAVESLP